MRRKPTKPQKPDERFDVYLTVQGKDLFSKRYKTRRIAECHCDHVNQVYRRFGHTTWIKVIKPDVNGVFPALPDQTYRAPV